MTRLTSTETRAPTDDELNAMWHRAKMREMLSEERNKQRLLHLTANGALSDPRITLDTMRATKTLIDAEG